MRVGENRRSGSIEFEPQGEAHYRLSGELGFATVEGALRRSRELFGTDGGEVSVDMSGLREIDSAGLALIIEWRRWFTENGGRLRLQGVPEQLRSLARISELEDVLELG